MVARADICFHKQGFHLYTESISGTYIGEIENLFRTSVDFVPNVDYKISSLNFRNHILNYPVHKQITYNQKQLKTDFCITNESIDNRTGFRLRPPELHVISNIEIYFKCFEREKPKPEKNVCYGGKEKLYPWVDCISHFVYIRPLRINIIREFLLAPRSEHFHLDNVRKMECYISCRRQKSFSNPFTKEHN